MKHIHSIHTHSVLLYALLHFLLAFLLLMLTQGLFAWVNRELFPSSTFGETLLLLLGNIHFGLSGTAMVLLPFMLLVSIPLPCRYRKGYLSAAQVCAGIGLFFLLAANIADIPYFQWTLRRTAGDIFSYITHNFEGGLLLGQMIKDFWLFFLIFFLLFGLWVWLQRHIRLLPPRKPSKLYVSLLEGLLIFLLGVTAFRGGWIAQHKPLAPVDASRYAQPGKQALVINTPFSIIRTLGNASGLKPLHYFDDEAVMERIFTPVHVPKGKLSIADSNTNVVILLLESFSEEYMGCINQGGESYTPFLDSLASHCLLLQGRANGKRSIESLPAIFLGIPHLMDEAYITSSFSQNNTLSLPQLLSRHGYTSAFFHGAYNGSMNFDGFCNMIGFDRYYGMDQYPERKDFDGTWGIFDEPFLQFAASELSTLPQPFFSTIYTISSHHPFTIPPQYKGHFKQGEIPILETIGYADNALRHFFQTASRQPWFGHTIFIITADHAAMPLSPYYREHAYNVPMMIYWPGHELVAPPSKLMQHTDIMPTVVDILGLPDTNIAFGHSLFDTLAPFHIAYPGSHYLLERDGHTCTFDGSNFNPAETPVEDQFLLKALLQQYSNRLIENRLR